MMYKGIEDMPIFNWWECEKNLLQYVFKDRERVYWWERSKAEQRLYEIKSEFFEKIALNAELEAYILKKFKLQELRCDMFLSNDRAFETKYLILKAEIKALEKRSSQQAVSSYDQKAALDKYLGFRVDITKTTVVEYHAYVQQMSNHYKQLHIQANRAKANS